MLSNSCSSLSSGPPKSIPSVGAFIADMLPHNVFAPLRIPSTRPLNDFRDTTNAPPLLTIPQQTLYPPTAANPVFPRVITFNPTPHPTLPATPILRNATFPAQRPYTDQQSPERRSPEWVDSTHGGKAHFADVGGSSRGESRRMQRKSCTASDSSPALANCIHAGEEIPPRVAGPIKRRHISAGANKHQPTLNVRSSSRHGDASLSPKATPTPLEKEPAPIPVKVAHPQRRKIFFLQSPPSNCTTDSDDDSWVPRRTMNRRKPIGYWRWHCMYSANKIYFSNYLNDHIRTSTSRD